MKVLGKILLFFVVLLAIIFVFRNTLLKAAVNFGVSKAVGVNADVKSIDLDVSNTLLDIKDLRVENPEGFSDKYLIDIPVAFVDFEFKPFLKGDVHLTDVRLHLKELLLVKNAKGQLNINVLREKLEAKQPKPASGQEKPTAPSDSKAEKPKGALKIDNLSLKIDKVLYKDYTVGKDPLVQSFDLNIDEKFQNITDPQAIIGIIVSKALRNSAIARLTNLDPQQFLQSNIFDSVTIANQAVNKIGDKAMSTVGNQLGASTEAVKETADAVMGSLKDKVKIPFGSSSKTKDVQ